MADERRVIVNFGQVASAFGGREATQIAAGIAEAGGDGEDEQAMAAVLGRALAELKDAETEPDVLSSPDDQAAALLQAYLAERAAEEGKLEEGTLNALEAKFDDHDIFGWLRGAGWRWIKAKLEIGSRHPRPPWPDDRAAIDNGARVAVFGDWGTGMYGALPVSQNIESDPDGFQAVVHLGDVYYAGTKSEVEQRMLDVWPWIDGAVNRACNSNHEMYSGGGPYFTQTLPRFEQTSSAFALENDHWLLIGLDTAYDEFDLGNDQIKWLADVVAHRDGRAVVLFSHHQLYSHFARQGTALQRDLEGFLRDRTITAWYWGHEHLLAFYEQHGLWGLHGRCVGHGGYPYFREEFGNAPTEELGNDHVWRTLPATQKSPAARVLDGPNPDLGKHAPKYGPHGYLALELHEDHLVEVVHGADGTRLWEGRVDALRS